MFVSLTRNSIPPTTTMDNFETKIRATEGKCHVDVGFWGGVVPGNAVWNMNTMYISSTLLN
jgi:allantoinase